MRTWVMSHYWFWRDFKDKKCLCLLKNDSNSLLVQPSEIIEIVRWRITKWENQKYSPWELYLHHHRNDGNWAERKMKFFLFPCFFLPSLSPLSSPPPQLYLQTRTVRPSVVKMPPLSLSLSIMCPSTAPHSVRNWSSWCVGAVSLNVISSGLGQFHRECN